MFTPAPLRRTFAAALRDLNSTRTEVRISAARDLALVGEEDPLAAGRALEPLLRDPSADVRGEAALALGALEARPQVGPVAALLEDSDSTVRQYAAMALGQMGGAAALAQLERARTEAGSDVRFQVLLAIAAIDPQRGFEVGLLALADEDVWIASEAALQLGTLLADGAAEDLAWCTEADRARAREALRARLETPSGRVAVCAALALAGLGDERGQEKIIAFLRGTLTVEASEDMAELRLRAIECLGELGGAEARATLEPLAARLFATRERELSRAALARLGDERAREQIVVQLRSWSAGRRLQAVQLAKAGRVREAVPALVALLHEGRLDPLVAVDVFEVIGGDDAVRALEQLAEGEGEARDAARAALESMARRS
jgi:HEAT repeat protein